MIYTIRNFLTDIYYATRVGYFAFRNDWQYAKACRAEAEAHYNAKVMEMVGVKWYKIETQPVVTIESDGWFELECAIHTHHDRAQDHLAQMLAGDRAECPPLYDEADDDVRCPGCGDLGYMENSDHA